MPLDIFKDSPVLENSRILLRPIQESDFDNLLPFSLHEPDIWKYGWSLLPVKKI
jgi:RimJ/RimL family protein N-acetyltransferase